jgi:alkylhydroperoxidase family enzyme
MHDPYADQMRRLVETVLRGPGTLDPSIRQAIAGTTLSGDSVPEALRAYVEKVSGAAYDVTDDEVQALLAAGYSEDQIFEATLSAALGAALLRLEAGLGVLQAASEEGS